MARVYGIKKRLVEYNIDEKLAKEIIGNGNLINIITRMEQMLDPDMVYQILDSCACGYGLKQSVKYRKELAGKTLKEKIRAFTHNDFYSDWNLVLSDDHTLMAGWRWMENEKFSCGCTATVKTSVKVAELAAPSLKNLSNSQIMPLSYCYCCAGLYRRNLQNALDIKLKTKEIVSSPINSKGEMPCEFIFEIIG